MYGCSCSSFATSPVPCLSGYKCATDVDQTYFTCNGNKITLPSFIIISIDIVKLTILVLADIHLYIRMWSRMNVWTIECGSSNYCPNVRIRASSFTHSPRGVPCVPVMNGLYNLIIGRGCVNIMWWHTSISCYSQHNSIYQCWMSWYRFTWSQLAHDGRITREP